MPQTAFTVEELRMASLILIPMACIPAYIAKKKGRNFLLWYLYGYGFFIFALIHSLMLKPKNSGAFVGASADIERRDNPVPLSETRIPKEIIINKRRINYSFIDCPMEALSYVLLINVASATKAVRLNLFAQKPIKTFDISLEIFDTMNGKIADKAFSGVAFSEGVDFDISEYKNAMYVKFTPEKITLADGTEWIREGESIECDIDIMDGYELEKLKSLTNKYAVCLPYEKEDYWVCSCSKVNNGEVCSLCGISKEELFDKANKEVCLSLKNDLIRKNNLDKFNNEILSRIEDR